MEGRFEDEQPEHGAWKRDSVAKILGSITRHASLQTTTSILCLTQTRKSSHLSRVDIK
jgi:hypothetical protein